MLVKLQNNTVDSIAAVRHAEWWYCRSAPAAHIHYASCLPSLLPPLKSLFICTHRNAYRGLKKGFTGYHDHVATLLFYLLTSRYSVVGFRSHRLGLTPHSKVWVGAWWIGFVFMAAFCLLLAIPILAYPSSLPGSEKLEKVSEAHQGDAGSSGERQEAFTQIKQIPRALLALLRNPTFFFLNLAGASEGLVISGFAVFLPKLIENQFSLTAVASALVMGKSIP